MRIGVLGAGNVGGTLGAGWCGKGHEVMFSARDLADPEVEVLLQHANAKAGTVQEAAAFGDVVVLTVPWAAAEETIRNAGKVTGKILLDCTNPVVRWPQVESQNKLSGGEKVARWAGDARVVKIFNTTGFDNMANPRFGTETLTMFYAGDDSEAKETAADLAIDLGFEVVDAGPLANARFLEMLASFWGTLAYGQKLGRAIGFRLLRR